MQPLVYFTPLRFLPVFFPTAQIQPGKLNPNKSAVECPLCCQEFKSKKGLSQHHAKVHVAPVKAMPCGVCGKLFKHKYAVKFHIRQVHDKETQVKCPVCCKLIYNKYTLKKHILRFH